MNSMQTKLATLALMTAALPLVAQKVNTDYEHAADFSQYHTFCFGPVHSSNDIVENRIRKGITTDLTRSGFRLATGGMRYRSTGEPYMGQAGCDLTVSAIGSVQNQQEYTTFYNGFGPGWGWGGWGGGWGGFDDGPAITNVQQIPIGTLVVDLYDAKTKKLVFRGTAQDRVSDHPDTNRRDLYVSIDKIFKKFPPKTDNK